MIRCRHHWQQRKPTSEGLVPENREDSFQALRPTEAWHSLTNAFQLVSIHTRHQCLSPREEDALNVREDVNSGRSKEMR